MNQTSSIASSIDTQNVVSRATPSKTPGSDSFSEMYVKFSKHASQRLCDRNISLSDSQNKRLSEGVAKAEEKGINDSLVMVDSLAFIVNVPTQTVVTALDETEAADHIYTNIDGAVIA